jgi:hypothetical protein
VTRTLVDTPIMRLSRHRTLLRAARALVVLLVGGLLLFPATCAHAATPHSLFQSMQVEVVAQPGVDDHHAHHAAAHAAFTPAPDAPRFDRTTATDFPDTVSTALATAPVATTDDGLTIVLPPAPRVAAEPVVARGPAPTPPDAPPPRLAA